MKKKIRIIGVLLLMSVMAFGYFHFIKRPPIETDSGNEKIIFQKQGDLTFLSKDNKVITNLDIEIADTDFARQKGLMARPTMEANQGMLFIFDYPQVQSFWMKDTILALDLVFVDENKQIVHIGYDAVPFSEAIISSDVPAQYVVEVNAGYCKKNNIEVGGKINFRRLQKDNK